MSLADLVKKYSLSASTISTIINEKNQEKIKHLFDNELIKPECKRMKLPIYQKVDEAMDLWFKNTMKEKNVTLDGTLIQAQALKFAAMEGYVDFKASNGWLDKFKIRHNITYKKIVGEGGNAYIKLAEDWMKNKLIDLIKDYEAQNIFNADETSLFWRALPNKFQLIT